MKYVFKGFFLIFVVLQLLLHDNIAYFEVGVILIIIASNIFREKYKDYNLLLILEFFVIGIGANHNPYFAILYGIVTYDVIYKGLYLGVIPIMAGVFYFTSLADNLDLVAIVFLCGFFAYMSRQLSSKESFLKEQFDKERKYRYELERARAQLLSSSKEAAHLAEIKERNRIARDIHDNIGHSIAGILMQLQAVDKLWDRDEKKASGLLKNSISSLSNSLVTLRETVHNIKPKENLGIDYIRGIINNFTYCPVDFRYQGDIRILPPTYLEIISTNIKEALTNAAKHSKADKIEINLEVNPKYIRLLIKDNGVGCSQIKENLGLNSMKDRVKNVGGNISISGSKGFLIVCFIPLENIIGGDPIENTYSR